MSVTASDIGDKRLWGQVRRWHKTLLDSGVVLASVAWEELDDSERADLRRIYVEAIREWRGYSGERQTTFGYSQTEVSIESGSDEPWVHVEMYADDDWTAMPAVVLSLTDVEARELAESIGPSA